MSNSCKEPDSVQSRRDVTSQKLQSALHRLVTGAPLHPQNQSRTCRFTVTALSREAGVSRNAIYTNHRSYVDQLTRLFAGRDSANEIAGKARQDNDQRQRLQRLATENACLLKRAIEAEHRADHLERRCASLLRQLESALSVSTISSLQP